MKSMYRKLLLTVVVGIVLALLLYYFGLSHYFSLENIKAQASFLKTHVHDNYIGSVIVFLVVFTGLIGFTLPVTGPMGIIAGFLFGLFPGVIYSMISVFIGTTISFLVVRRAMGQIARNQYSDQLSSFNDHIKQYGYTYLITLQLLTVVPYFVINTLAVLGEVPLSAFIWTTLAGSFPVVLIYVFAGRQLYMIQSWRDILSKHMLILLVVLAALALLPMLVKKFRKTNI
jgi:Uncharacterized conserved protein